MIASYAFSIAMLAIFGSLLFKRFRWWNRDRRRYRHQTQREFVEAILLFLVAVGVALASASYYLGGSGNDSLWLKVGVGMSWGAILGTGIWMLTEPPPSALPR